MHVPKYVRKCECGGWYLEIWKIQDPSDRRLIPFRCLSWRHAGPCRLAKGAQDYCRIRDAMESRTHWTHLTLTYAQRGKELNYQTFRDGVIHWSRLRKKLIYYFGDIKYIQTWEVHRTGWPHVHIAMSNVAIYKLCSAEKTQNFNYLISGHAQDAGFGERGSIDRLRGRTGLSAYLTKLASELVDGSVKSQIPVNAPPHFRRLRASRGLLPPVKRNEDYTGELLECSADGELEPVKKKK